MVKLLVPRRGRNEVDRLTPGTDKVPRKREGRGKKEDDQSGDETPKGRKKVKGRRFKVDGITMP